MEEAKAPSENLLVVEDSYVDIFVRSKRFTCLEIFSQSVAVICDVEVFPLR